MTSSFNLLNFYNWLIFKMLTLSNPFIFQMGQLIIVRRYLSRLRPFERYSILLFPLLVSSEFLMVNVHLFKPLRFTLDKIFVNQILSHVESSCHYRRLSCADSSDLFVSCRQFRLLLLDYRLVLLWWRLTS